MSTHPSEREPLLPERSPTVVHHEETQPNPAHSRVGPLDISRSTRYGILAGVWSASFLSALNQTLVPTMLPSISSEFKSFNQASWLGTSYLLATCTFTPLYGRLCNGMGRKNANHLALLFAGAGVLGCGLSNSMEMLILSRFLAGIGGGGLMTTSSIIVSDMYSMRSRGLTQGIASVFNGLGLGLGGPFGGIITDWLGWRWAFLIQVPFFIISFSLTSGFLHYVTPGKGKSTREILKRIDYGGSAMLFMTVGAVLVFLSARYNEGLPWSNITVVISLSVAAVCSVAFILVELFVSPEPVLAPFLLKKKIPVLVGASNFLVATCNFSIIYFFPMYFQTVLATSAATAGLHLVPNSVGLSLGSLFAGYMMHLTGRYKTINLIFGWFPFIGAVMIASLDKDSSTYMTWLSIMPLGFGNAVVLQTMLIALLVRLPESQMAIGTGFGQLFRGIGQVGGVAISSAVFQSRLDGALRQRIQGPNAEDIILKIRQSSNAVASLPADLQKIARESYAMSLKTVFVFSACSTLLAFLVRLPIPDKHLDHRPKSEVTEAEADIESLIEPGVPDDVGYLFEDVVEDEEVPDLDGKHPPRHRRRLSTYESAEDVLALELEIEEEEAEISQGQQTDSPTR
ncbi:Multidrug resistance protein fnx1 [Hypsizygus marmoreus]|uniref:Multidrug resistance protein fnx1 n=1 Tax=Hypsizygus marmoreus TaxID=39966 RepID=A0A369JDJ7_HYPMA|nr:Multidrug resistance protein fnx1 [Hypsizygus marmoreus]